MKKLYLAILGEGPTAISVFDYYKSRLKKVDSERCKLITESLAEEGATTKGVKTANQIVPKLPYVRPGDREMLREVVKRVKDCEMLLQKSYVATNASPYIGQNCYGIRDCRNEGELETMEFSGLEKQDRPDIVNAACAFSNHTLGIRNNRRNLYVYNEKTWNVHGYTKQFRTSIKSKDMIKAATARIIDVTSAGNVIVEVLFISGERERYEVEHLLICKGIGNVSFESDIKCLLECNQVKQQNDIVFLPLGKCIIQPTMPLPEFVTSLIIPEAGICFTNEEIPNTYSILFDTNGRAIQANRYSKIEQANILNAHREQLHLRFPRLPTDYLKKFICSLTMDPSAFINNYERHFRFIITPSVMDSVKYINLPYFTVIKAAVNALPFNINKLYHG